MGSLGGIPCKIITGHGVIPLNRRYKKPTQHVSLTFYPDCPISTKKTPQHGVREVLYGVMSEGCLFDFPTVRVSSCKFWNDSSILIITLKKTVFLTVLAGSFKI